MLQSRWIVMLGLGFALAACDGRGSTPSLNGPSDPNAPVLTTPVVFTDSNTGFSTSDLHDVQDQIVQITRGGSLIWTADGTSLPGFRAMSFLYEGVGTVWSIEGPICAEECVFEVRFGAVDGHPRAYLTVDYGHDNPGTLVDVDVVSGKLVVAATSVFPPGTFTLSGMVTEVTPDGPAPVEGVSVYRGVTWGWQSATTDRNGYYQIEGLITGTQQVAAFKDGYVDYRSQIAVLGDRRFDFEVVRR